MIRRDIQTHADVGAKSADGLELKTGQLQNIPLIGPRTVHQRRRRRADIASHLRRNSRLAQDVPDHRRRGRLTVGAGDPDSLPLQIHSSQLDFADHVHAALPRRFDRLEVGRNAGREHDQVGALEHFRRLGLEGHVQALQDLGCLGQLGKRTRVGRPQMDAALLQQLQSRQPRSLQPHHQRPHNLRRISDFGFRISGDLRAVASSGSRMRIFGVS